MDSQRAGCCKKSGLLRTFADEEDAVGWGEGNGGLDVLRGLSRLRSRFDRGVLDGFLLRGEFSFLVVTHCLWMEGLEEIDVPLGGLSCRSPVH